MHIDSNLGEELPMEARLEEERLRRKLSAQEAEEVLGAVRVVIDAYKKERESEPGFKFNKNLMEEVVETIKFNLLNGHETKREILKQPFGGREEVMSSILSTINNMVKLILHPTTGEGH